ncbi:hypothetical protein VHEMI07231 [[Torrubiella] hemipterigena]|uniref:Uncharacterized protein n=1 Tax=[Torrubiella] hemipterigena TaxID=1531966 RepID=A0A0A1T9Q8_9HYPO|nr:hypothetical protein VHEMI07231 [[Torrubiella] hemipterigena]
MPSSKKLSVVDDNNVEVKDGYEFALGRGPRLKLNLNYGSEWVHAYVQPLDERRKDEDMEEIKGSPFRRQRRWSSVPLNGTLADDSKAEEGSYRFVTRMLRLYGDSTKKEDWEVKQSVSFSIEYKQ